MFLKSKSKALPKSQQYRPIASEAEDSFETTEEYDTCTAAILKNFDDIIAMEIAGEGDMTLESKGLVEQPTQPRTRNLNPLSRISRLVKPKSWFPAGSTPNPMTEYLHLTAPERNRKICGLLKEIVKRLWTAQRAVEKGQLYMVEMRPFNVILHEAQE